MQDGIGQTGAGLSDMRLAGDDLQHNRQPHKQRQKPMDEFTQRFQAGGPMKEQSELHRHLDIERLRHSQR